MLHVTKSVTINRPRAAVYQFWRDFEQSVASSWLTCRA